MPAPYKYYVSVTYCGKSYANCLTHIICLIVTIPFEKENAGNDWVLLY